MNILIVDDNQESSSLLATRFEVMGHQADFITDAKEALKLCKSSNIEKYDYILLDLYLNGINGMDIYEEILKQKLDKKVVFISGCDEKNEIFCKALKSEAPIITKVFDCKMLVIKLESGFSSIREWSKELLKERGIKTITV